MRTDAGCQMPDAGCRMPDAGRRINLKSMAILVAMLLLGSGVFAEDIASLDKKITGVELQISTLTRLYEKQKSEVSRILAQIEQEKKEGNSRAAETHTKSAYDATDRLNQLLAQINELNRTRAQLCENWRDSYRKNVDALLQRAESESDKVKKAEIGKTLQTIQARNTQLCVESLQPAPPQGWRALKVESYDGPQEIGQKLQLLQDISREISIGVAKMDRRYQEALREERTRERAREFVQEGTLFTEGLAIRPGAGSSTTFTGDGAGGQAPTPAPITEMVDRALPQEQPGMTQVSPQNDWLSGGTSQQREKEYRKARENLLLEQKEIQHKIQEFENRAKDLTLP